MTKNSGYRDAGLKLDNVSKSFGGNTVLNNLSVQLGQGELLSLLGPSGCGKSTTLNMISGFDSPDSGTVYLDGNDISRKPPNKRDTAIVFQNYALFPHMTVVNNVSYGLKVRKLQRKTIVNRVDTVLELLDIGWLKDRYPSELSGGQQQRVSLARAIAVQPSLLLLDEPLSNLDTKLRQEIRLEIRRLQQELEQTAVFVTHDQEEALMISDYVAVLNKGAVEQFGTPTDLWSKPQTVYVADFMGVENILRFKQGAREVAAEGAMASMGSVVPDSLEGISHVGFRPGGALLRSKPEEVSPGAMAIHASVRAKVYVGTHFRYSCELRGDDGTTLYVEQATTEDQFDPGESVVITVAPEAVLPLKGSVVDEAQQGESAAELVSGGVR